MEERKQNILDAEGMYNSFLTREEVSYSDTIIGITKRRNALSRDLNSMMVIFTDCVLELFPRLDTDELVHRFRNEIKELLLQ